MKIIKAKILSLLYWILGYCNYSYIIDQSESVIIEKLHTLFNEKTSYYKAPNLKGKFVGNIFHLTRKRWFGQYIGSGEREPAFLEGNMQSSKNGTTKMIVFVRPNSVNFFLLISSIFVSFTIILFHLIVWNACSLFAIVMIISPFIIAASARHSSRRLRTCFERYIGIKESEIT